MANENNINRYDAVPYESYPYSNTHPKHLYTVAKLFNVDAPNPKTAKILELGCASGGNLVPIAIDFPKASCVGVDFSKVQIDLANKHKEKLGLKNIEFKELSIADIDESFGKFDYIIVHGILSWVSKEIQDKIFEICEKNLTDKGVAYISYNTLPGWNAVKSIREMMIYHTKHFSDDNDKVKQSVSLLDFIKRGNGTNNSNPYKNFIEHEIKNLENASASYLIHDHLEENNEPFYFHEFISKANKNKLQYLGESSIPSMYIGNFPKETTEVLKTAGDDIVRVEQYMDFVRNRRFRSTLLCNQKVKIDRNITNERMRQFYIKSDAKLNDNHKDQDITSGNLFEFSNSGGAKTSSRDKYIVAALTILEEKNCYLSATDLLAKVKSRLGNYCTDENFENILLNNLVLLLFTNFISISAFEVKKAKKLSKKPKTSDLSKYQATYSNWITNQHSNKINVDTFGRILLQYLNGKNDIDTIVDKMKDHVANNDISISEDGKPITDEENLKNKLRLVTINTLNKMVSTGVLVA